MTVPAFHIRNGRAMLRLTHSSGNEILVASNKFISNQMLGSFCRLLQG